jgi:hypothetical protein
VALAATAHPISSQRQREPRENNEFLRICVLEMNMRRAGKIEDDGPKSGRKAFWLPPRVGGGGVDVIDGAVKRRREPPGRWVGVTA